VLADAVVGIDHPPPVHVAVDGTAGGARGLADDLSRVLEARGRRCRRVSLDATGFLHRQGPGQGPIAHRGRPGDDLVVVDGRFLQHPEFQGAWELVVFLREDAGGDRDGDVSRYVAQVDPEIAADVVVDLHDPAWPVVRRVDPAVAGRLRPEVLLDETRAFFAPRAAVWEDHFPDDDAAYGAAVAELGLRAGQTALDAGCGTGRALPHLRAAVGPDGTVLGVDLTPEMLATARRHGRHRHALLAMADARRLPLRAGAVDGAFAAALLPHVPDPGRALADLARVVRPGGQLALFHPSGRAALAARQGRLPRDDDLLAPGPLDRLLRACGWSLASYDDGPGRFLALAERRGWGPGRPIGTGTCPGAEMEADTIETERLVLTPLCVSDAEQMAEVLADPRLHLFIGGRPATLDELRARYAAMTAGSSSPDEVWRNWVVRGRGDRLPVGTVQATLHRRDERWSAEIAWVLGVPYQGKGYAAEAARALVAWLTDRDIHEVVARIHPDHAASGRVARRAGLHPTADLVDGEVVWRTPGQG
jgi:RimJ/RimL family protein N-acetyltransferase